MKSFGNRIPIPPVNVFNRTIKTNNMKVSNKFKRILIASFGLFVLLFLVLVVHIALVTRNIHYDNASIQLGRIDFKEPLDSVKAKEINTKIRSITGVGNTHFNLKDGILIYSVNLNKNSNQAVYQKLMAEIPYKAERYVVTNEMATKGCPVMDKSTFAYQFSNTIQKIIN